jgi:RNA polymerase sigma factor (sigma-70 family)
LTTVATPHLARLDESGPEIGLLLERAAAGEESAWHEIVHRYAPLIWSVCRRYRLSTAAAEDVAGTVWLRLVDGLNTIREPAALPGWLVTVTKRECVILLRKQDRETTLDDPYLADSEAATDSWLLAEERRIALRDAFTRLPEPDRRLLSLLFSDPPTPYAEISAILGMPVGSIGPTRQRCLDRLRRSPSLAALLPQASTPKSASRARTVSASGTSRLR